MFLPKKIHRCLKCLCVLALPLLAAINASAESNRSRVVPGRYIVVLKPGAKATEVANTHGLNLHHQYAHALDGFAATLSERHLRALQNDPRVDFVEADVEVSIASQTIPTGVRRMGAAVSPAAKIDGQDERVNADIAIIDTGIDLTHPDLNVYQGVSFTTANATGNDDNGHGTHVAGIAAALDNGIGVVGVAPGARLWAVKVLDAQGSGMVSDIIAGIDYVTQHADQIEVANMSLSGQGLTDALRLAIQKSVAKGVVYVVAAGNSAVDIYGNDHVFGTGDDYFPASYPEVMTVSAIVDMDGKAGGVGTSSNYGPDDTIASFSDYSLGVVSGNPVQSPGRAIDVAAPGVNIFSTYKGGAYATLSGTSMASPHVAGAVALYVAQYGRAFDAAGVAHIRQALIDSAEPQTHWGPADTNPGRSYDTYPEGLLNAAWIGATTPPTNPPPRNDPPTVTINSPASGSTFGNGATIMFSGSASDSQDGNLTSKLVWTSSINGQIGTGGSFSRTLSSGTHAITARVTDSAGNTTSSSLSIKVLSGTPPTVTITSPANGSAFASGAIINFSGNASDLLDGSLTSKLVWTSSIDGVIGNGGSFSRSLSSGTHTITARVTDSTGNTGSASISITVNAPIYPAFPPSISALVWPSGYALPYGTPITFWGFAVDFLDGDISSKLVWVSSIDGRIGTGATFVRALSSGAHTITVNATDSAGLTGKATISVVVAPPQ